MLSMLSMLAAESTGAASRAPVAIVGGVTVAGLLVLATAKRQVRTIALNTFLKTIRQTFFLVLLLISMIIMALLPGLAAYTMQDDNKELVNLGLSTLIFLGWIVAALTATGAVSDEIESKTVLSVVSKPVGRPIFIVGKYLGVAGAAGVWFYISSIAFLLGLRHGVMSTAADQLDTPVIVIGLLGLLSATIVAGLGNYFFRWVFTSSFTIAGTIILTIAAILVLIINKEWKFQSIAAEFAPKGAMADGQVIIALVMVFEAVLVICAVAVAASTRVGRVLNLIICACAVMLGLMIGTFSLWWRDAYPVFRLISWMTPNLQFLWQGEALTQGNLIPLSHLGWVTAYTFLHITALLCLAIALFQTREVG